MVETEAEKKAKGFTCWQQFVVILFCQIGQAQSLWEICGRSASCRGKLKHLGINSAPNRSTLSYANEHRPWELHQRIFYQLLGKSSSLIRPRGIPSGICPHYRRESTRGRDSKGVILPQGVYPGYRQRIYRLRIIL